MSEEDAITFSLEEEEEEEVLKGERKWTSHSADKIWQMPRKLFFNPIQSFMDFLADFLLHIPYVINTQLFFVPLSFSLFFEKNPALLLGIM